MVFVYELLELLKKGFCLRDRVIVIVRAEDRPPVFYQDAVHLDDVARDGAVIPSQRC